MTLECDQGSFATIESCWVNISQHMDIQESHAMASLETNGYAYSECTAHYCDNDPDNTTLCYTMVSMDMCVSVVDMVWGVLHLIVGILGFSFNMIALVVFLRLGRTKPYYVIAIFETLTDLITSMVAIYSGVFLVIGRPKSFDTPLCFVAGWLWNWNMVTTPMLLSLSGIFRIRAVYYPHDSSFVTTKPFVS
eukprot:sb/3471058/